MAGALGGGVHGIVGTLWDHVAATTTKPTTTIKNDFSKQGRLVATLTTTLPRMTCHHGMAHAALFGSYELVKRQLLHMTGLDSTLLHHGPAYLGSIVVAGGVAGQVQHVMSHYTEQWLRLEEGVVILEATTTTTAMSVLKFRPPVMRSVVMAFPASAIGFVAFEYGRNLAGSPSS
jgi:hypothetical protein